MVNNPIEDIALKVEDFEKNKIDYLNFMESMSKYNKLLFYFQKRIKETDVSKIEIDEERVVFSFSKYGIKLITDKSCRSVVFEYLTFGEYEEKELNFLLSVIQDGDSIFDIGAHIGWYSLIFGKQFPNSTIHAFEPIDTTFNVLSNNVKMNNLSNIQTHNYALYDVNDTLDFNYFDGGAVLSSPANLIDQKTNLKKCNTKKMDLVVENLKVDKIDVIKCDIEGCELFALRGGEKAIARNKPIIFIELYNPWFQKMGYNFEDINRFMQSLGYNLFSVNKAGKLIHEDQSIKDREDYNFFYLHKQKHSQIIEERSI